MDKLQLTGQKLGRVYNFRNGHLHTEHFGRYQVKLPNLKLKTQPKQLLGSLPLVIVLLRLILNQFWRKLSQKYLTTMGSVQKLENWTSYKTAKMTYKIKCVNDT